MSENENASTAHESAKAELIQFVERYERMDEERQNRVNDLKEIMAEAKSRGYDTKVLKKVIALRKRDRDDLAEEEALLEIYRDALGV